MFAFEIVTEIGLSGSVSGTVSSVANQATKTEVTGFLPLPIVARARSKELKTYNLITVPSGKDPCCTVIVIVVSNPELVIVTSLLPDAVIVPIWKRADSATPDNEFCVHCAYIVDVPVGVYCAPARPTSDPPVDASNQPLKVKFVRLLSGSSLLAPLTTLSVVVAAPM